MPAPTHARQSDRGGRTYIWPPTGENFFSVTSRLKALSAPGLVYWSANQVAQGALYRRDEWLAILAEEGEDAALRWLKDRPWDKRDKAADAGSAVHGAIAQLVLTGKYEPWPTKLRGFQRQFDRFLQAYQPEWLTSEATVYSRKYGYAGTLDFRARIGGEVLLGDVKSGERIYDEVALQLAAYRYADWIDLGDMAETPMPASDAAVVLHLRPQTYHLRYVTAGPEQHRVFLHVAEAHRWQEAVKSTSLIGEMVMPVNLVEATAADLVDPAPPPAPTNTPTLDDLLGGYA